MARSRRKQKKKFNLTDIADSMAFSWKVREALYKHLSAQIENGVPVHDALDGFRGRLIRRKKVSSDKIVGQVISRMRNGATLSNALSTWVPADELNVIDSGEQGGKLPQALNLVIQAKKSVENVKKSLKSAVVTPLVYLAAVFGMLWAIGKYVTPSLTEALPVNRAHGSVLLLYQASAFATSWYAVIPPLAVVIIVIIVIYSLPRWTGPLRIKAENYFPYNFYRDTHGYTWLMGFASLLQAGMSDIEILKRQHDEGSPWIKERLSNIRRRMENGKSLSESLLLSEGKLHPPFGFPNPDIVDDISSLHGFKDFPEKITVLAMQWSISLEEATKASAGRFGALMQVIMYLLMGFLMIAINEMSVQVGSIPGM